MDVIQRVDKIWPMDKCTLSFYIKQLTTSSDDLSLERLIVMIFTRGISWLERLDKLAIIQAINDRDKKSLSSSSLYIRQLAQLLNM